MTNKKAAYAFEYAIIALAEAFLQYTETKVGVEFLAAPFMFAVLFMKRNALIVAPVFFVTGVLTNVGTETLVSCGAALMVLLILYSVQYLTKKRLPSYAFAVAAAIAALPYVFFDMSPAALGLEIAAVPLSAASFWAFTTADYALKVKKLRFPFVRREKVAFLAVFVILGLGLGYMRLPAFSAAEPVAIVLFQLLATSGAAQAAAGAAVALGGAVADAENALIIILYALPALLFDKEHSYFGAVAGVAAEAGAMAAGIIDAEYFRLIAPSVAALAAIAVPLKARLRFSLPVYKEGGGLRTIVNKTRAETAGKLGQLSNALKTLGEALALDTAVTSMATEETAHLLSVKVCSDCPGRERCSKSLGGGETEIALREITERALKQGKVNILDATPFLSSVCVRLRSVIDGVNALAEEERNRQSEARETEKAKGVIIEEVNALSGILKKLSDEVAKPLSYSAESERKIRQKLAGMAIPVGEVYVYGGTEATLTIPQGEGRRQAVKEAVESVLGVKLTTAGEERVSGGRVALSYTPQSRYRVAYGVRQIAAGEYGSGDADRALRLGHGKVLIVLSDGMGHDRAAAINSSLAVRLIECFARAGFPAEAMLKCTGRLLELRGREEFNAVDIALIDTETGRTDIIKQGARESFIACDGEVEVAECGSLPLGIVEAEPVIDTVTLSTGKFLVMLSDGVLDVMGREKIIDVLSEMRFVNPDDVAGEIMKEYSLMAGASPDDASVIAVRLVDGRY